MSIAIYPGSFDPITNGHIDIIERALSVFERLIIAISDNPQKSQLFSLGERVALMRASLAQYKNIEIDTFDGLLVDYAQSKQVPTILRGLRAASDFEYEFQLAAMNRKLTKKVDTVFMMTGERNFYVSSRLVKEVASFGGDVSEMVPKAVALALQAHFRQGKNP